MTVLPYSPACFVCGRDNPRGLRLRFEHAEGWVRTRCSLDASYNGFLARTHGGIVAGLIDEAMGWATVLEGDRFSYTAELNVRYKKPVPVETEILVRGRVRRYNRRLAFAEGEIRSVGDELLVTGEGKFVFINQSESSEIAGALIYDPGAWRPSGG